jgi:hypothetical protein
MVVYILMYRYKRGNFGLLKVFYTLNDAIEYRDNCIRIDKINHIENDCEYKIQSIRVEKRENK